MLLLILAVLLVLAILGAGFGHSRFGYVGWSPAGLILVIVAVLWFTGYIHVR